VLQSSGIICFDIRTWFVYNKILYHQLKINAKGSNDMGTSSGKDYFYISFRDHRDGKVVSIRAKNVSDSSLGLGFIAISDFIFDTGGVVVNPAEEDLKKRFEGVKTLHLSIYSILSIEEVGPGHKGLKFKQDKSNLVVLSRDMHPPAD